MQLVDKSQVGQQGWNIPRLAAAIALCGAAPAFAAPPPAPASSPIAVVGHVEANELIELSGLAVSRIVGNRWWGLNDSGHAPKLYALDAQGRSLGEVSVDAAATDWEDLASFRVDGHAVLAIADTGDNFSLRSDVAIHLVEEPLALADSHHPLPVRTLRFRYEDGPRDVESLAVDVAHRRFLLLDKGRRPAGLYALPMDSPADRIAIARRLGDVPPIWAGRVPPALPAGDERYRGAATAMDLSADGQRLVVLTYRHVAEYRLGPGEDWAPVLSRAPATIVRLPRQRLLEAIGYDAAAGQVLIGGEAEHAPLLRWSPDPQKNANGASRAVRPASGGASQ